jgi:hypothetical protein
MLLLILITLPTIVLGSGSFFLWSIHRLELPTM